MNATIALDRDGDHAWTIARSIGILSMQGGFALLEAGCVRPANRANIMMKNIADMSFGMVFFLIIGYSLCFADSSGFIGGLDNAALLDDSDVEWTYFFYHFSFAATTGTIVSGAVAGRMKFLSYIVLSSICTTNFIYPVAVHWAWSESGWLMKMGFIDFSGTGVIHLVGGAAALQLTLVLGPRIGRFSGGSNPYNVCLTRLATRIDAVFDSLRATGRLPTAAVPSITRMSRSSRPRDEPIVDPKDFAVNDPVNIIYGTFVLAIGWLHFNMSGTLGVTGGRAELTGRIGVVTMVGGAFGAVAGMVYSYMEHAGMMRIEPASMGCLAGLVAITGACAVINVWESALCGFIGGGLACAASARLEAWKIDDPVGAVPVHFVGGVWGLLVVGLFSHGPRYGPAALAGVFHGGGGRLLAIQALGAICLTAWTLVSSLVLMWLVHACLGLRVSRDEELKGLDKTEHGVGDDAEARRARQVAARAYWRRKLRLRGSATAGTEQGTSCDLGVADVSGKGCRTGALSRPDELSAVASTPAMAAAPAAASPAEAV